MRNLSNSIYRKIRNLAFWLAICHQKYKKMFNYGAMDFWIK